MLAKIAPEINPFDKLCKGAEEDVRISGKEWKEVVGILNIKRHRQGV